MAGFELGLGAEARVRAARGVVLRVGEGWTWERVGVELGVSWQAAQQLVWRFAAEVSNGDRRARRPAKELWVRGREVLEEFGEVVLMEAREVIEGEENHRDTEARSMGNVSHRCMMMNTDGEEVEVEDQFAEVDFEVRGDSVVVRFGCFGRVEYDLFLRSKLVPEGVYRFEEVEGRPFYEFECPVRFAGLLGLEVPGVVGVVREFPGFLYDYQVAVVKRALAARRFAVWADTGLGKTLLFWEWAFQVLARCSRVSPRRHGDTEGEEEEDQSTEVGLGSRVLVLSPPSIVDQSVEQCREFYGVDVRRLESLEVLRRWCKEGSGVAIASYYLFVKGVVEEVRWCDGVVLDESSILKTGGGVIKWNLIKSCRGVPYKLSCTATPAPNDTMEYASQGSFLEKLRDEGEIIWTFFKRDKRGDWSLKPHAREGFYRFMAGWSIYLRDPSRYGWHDVLRDLPEPEVLVRELEMTEEQRVFSMGVKVETSGDMFGDLRMGIKLRSKLSQVAKGFVYGEGKKVKRVESRKPGVVVDLVREELAEGEQVIVWTVFDEECEVLKDEGLGVESGVEFLTGKTGVKDRARILEDFRRGLVRCLVTRAALVGKGMNFQFCSVMVFSGFDDSFESIYQAERRCYRPGQLKRVRIHVPMIPELEGAVFENVEGKRRAFERDAQLMEDEYLCAVSGMEELGLGFAS